MAEKEFKFQEKRELGTIINDSFEFLKEEIQPVSKLVLRYVFPFILMYGGLQVYVQMKILNTVDFSNPDKLLANIGPFYLNIMLSSLFAVFVQSLLVATYYTYIEAYVRKGKGNFTFEDISDSLFSNSLQALGANFLLYFMVLVGIIMCFLPGIYLANTLSPVVMVLLFERKGIAHAFNRTWKLVHTGWWQTFALNLLALVIIYASGFLVTLPAGMVTGGSPSLGAGGTDGAENVSLLYWVLIGLSTIVSSLLVLIPYTFLAFQYFNLRERTEPSSPANRD